MQAAQVPVPPVKNQIKKVTLTIESVHQQVIVLSDSEMMRAQEIFFVSNKVTRQEKDHILSFMSGNYEHPSPAIGNVVAIKLSEKLDYTRKRDGTFMEKTTQTLFQMDYTTGGWSVITRDPSNASLPASVILKVPKQPLRSAVVLSRELIIAAREILTTAVKATRPEKAHIIKFMAGYRTNPFPELGRIVSIKLNDHEENVRSEDGTMSPVRMETHFQMNYAVGTWTIVQRRTEDFEESIVDVNPPQ